MMTLDNPSPFQITVGKYAFDWLSNAKELEISGITSGGIFLKSHLNKIIFFTTDNHLGPVNVIFDKPFPSSWQKGSTLIVAPLKQSFLLSNKSGSFLLNIKSVWKSPSQPERNIKPEEQTTRILKTAQQLAVLKSGTGLSPLLVPYIEKQELTILDDNWLINIWNTIHQLENTIQNKDNSQFLYLAAPLVGSGRGLTPSGDDFLSGLFLMQKRWFSTSDWLPSFVLPILKIFEEKTTAVSLTLFYCATQGEADFRLIQMADSLMNKEIDYQKLIFEVARWGNSSGADFFLGLFLAIRCFQKGT